MAAVCKCRNCGKMYDPHKSRADMTGFCSQACMHEKSKSLGYRKPRDSYAKDDEYDILRQNNCVGLIDKYGDACDYNGIPKTTILGAKRPITPF